MKNRASIWHEEIRRATNPKRVGALLFLSTIILFAGWNALQRRVPYERSFIDNWYGIYTDSFYPQLIALIAAFPFADSLVIDRKQGYLGQVLARTSYRKYLRSKAIVNALVGGLAAILPLVLMYLITSIFTTAPLNHPSVDAMALRPATGFLREIYFNNPDGFIWMILGLVFVVGAAFASLGLAASLLINNRFVALGAPLILFNGLEFFAERTRFVPDFLTPMRTLLTRSTLDMELIQTAQEVPSLFILPILILVLAVLGFIFLGKRERVLENKAIFEANPFAKAKKVRSVREGKLPLKPGGFGARFYLLAKRTLRPAYLLILFLIIVAVGVLFSRFLANQGNMAGLMGSQATEAVNAWDVVFVAIGNPYVMSLLIANSYLIFVSTMQPETGFGQIALFRLGSRKQNWALQVMFLFLTAMVFTLVVLLGIYLVAVLNGYSASGVWSGTTLTSGVWVNLPAWLPKEMSLLQALLSLWVLLSLGFFAMGLAIYTLNVLFNQRLVGYLGVELFLLSSIGLTSVFMGKAKWLQSIPLIQNLLLSQIPYRSRTPGTLHFPFIYWAVLLAILIPLSLYFYRKQDFPVKTDEE